MQIHYLQHLPFEGLGSMEAWLEERGYPVSASHLYRGEQLPSLEIFDWLIVMGGPLGVADNVVPNRGFQDKAQNPGDYRADFCTAAAR